MPRWEPDARGRLEQAAMALFQSRGYARTTVGAIAKRAGLTERTFFRYFADKRDVIFSGSEELAAGVAALIARAPKGTPPLDAVASALEAAGAALQSRRDLAYVRARHTIVASHAELRERELNKMASLAAAITKALRTRGIGEPTASLVAEAGIAVFKVGFERWLRSRPQKSRGLAEHIRAAAAALKAAASA